MYQINIDVNLVDFLSKKSTLDSVTNEVFIERKINAVLFRLMKDELKETIEQSSKENIVRFDTSISEVKADITAEALPIVVTEMVK